MKRVVDKDLNSLIQSDSWAAHWQRDTRLHKHKELCRAMGEMPAFSL